MTKQAMKKAKDNELMFDYIQSYSILMLNLNSDRGTRQIEKHCNDLEEEIVKRGLLTEEQVKRLQS